MRVYQAEKDLGLADKLSIAHITCDLPVVKLAVDNFLHNIAFAEKTDDDLYYFQSILVSVGWNKNDDVFAAGEVWRARRTPKHKQINLEHGHRRVVGHIVDSFGIDENGKSIADSVGEEELPDKFHLVAPGVLYRFTCSKEEGLEEEMSALIAEIDEGKYFVSMECLFTDFDYALQKGNDSTIVKRNAATAGLTKYLRAYGGDGTYNDYKIGRVMKNLVFSGKGLTKKPANPESIIFTDTSKFSSNASIDDLVYLPKTSQEKKMDLEQKLAQVQEELKNTKSSLVLATEKNGDLEKKVTELGEKEVKSKLDALTVQVTEANEKIKTLEAQVKTEQTGRTDLEEKLKTAQAELTKATEKLAEVQKEKTQAERIDKWVGKTGVTKDVAQKAVANFVDLSETQFEAVLATQVAPEKKEETKTQALENAEPEKEATLASAGTVSNDAGKKLSQHFVKKSKK